MKFTLPLAVFLISTCVDAAAAADVGQEEKRWCTIRGQSCWKNKRDPEPAAIDPAQEAKRWCTIRGQSCWKAKRAADAFADAIKSSGGLAARDESGNEYAAMAKRQVDTLALTIAASTGDADAFYKALGLGEQFGVEEPAKPEKRDAGPWCTIRGQSCWKKREAEAKDEAKENKRRCTIRGQSCWKAKRAAEAVINAIDGVGEHDPRDLPFSPEARVKRDAEAEAACNAPGGACTLANRHLSAMHNVARSIVDAHSE